LELGKVQFEQSSSELISQYIQHDLAHVCDLKHILKTIIFNIFKINILIADSLSSDTNI